MGKELGAPVGGEVVKGQRVRRNRPARVELLLTDRFSGIVVQHRGTPGNGMFPVPVHRHHKAQVGAIVQKPMIGLAHIAVVHHFRGVGGQRVDPGDAIDAGAYQ